MSNDYLDACGAVAQLMEQRDTLIQNNRFLDQQLSKEKITASRLNSGVYNGVPAWRQLENAYNQQNEDRFRKYSEFYRNYSK